MKWHSHFWDSRQIEKVICQNSGTVVDLTVQPIVPSDQLSSEWRLWSLVETACFAQSFASQVLQGKVAEEPQLFAVSGVIVVVIVAAGLVEERMVCLGQQHSENKVVVVVVAVVKKIIFDHCNSMF